MSLLGEIRRRKVFQVAAVYAVVAWLIVQVVGEIAEPLSLPNWLDTVVIVLLGVGFPIAVILAWAFDITPEGIKVTDAAEPASQVTAQAPGLRLGLGIQLLVLLAVGFLVVDQYFVTDQPEPQATPQPPAPANVQVSRWLVTSPDTAPLTDMGGYDIQISPDGQRIAFFGGDIGGGINLFVRELDALEPRLIVDSTRLRGADESLNPFFSADGNWIAFGITSSGIMRVPIDGGPPQTLVENTGTFLGGTWGTDDTIVYATATGLHRTLPGRAPEQLLPNAEYEGGLYLAPVFLPGERVVLFSVQYDNEEVIATYDLEAGELKILIEGNVKNPRYAGGHIVYTRGTTLMAVPFDPDEIAVTGNPFVVAEGIRVPGPGAAADFALSASGTLAYVPGTDQTVQREVVWVDRNGNVTGKAVEGAVVGAGDPRLSPDGTRLLLRSGFGLGGSLWVYDLSGRPPIPLANIGDNRLGIWSPDGSRVAFLSNRGGGFELHTIPADGSRLEPEVLIQDLVVPTSWSADDELVLYRNSGSDLFVASAIKDAEVRELIATSSSEFDGTLSPDGRWLAYTSDRTGNFEIWVVPFPNGVPIRVSNAGGFEPRWAHDGSELYYMQGAEMMAVAVGAGTEPEFGTAERLFSAPVAGSVTWSASSYDVAADGRFLFLRPAAGDDVLDRARSFVVVQNFAAELEGR